jgi:hypothetical protein
LGVREPSILEKSKLYWHLQLGGSVDFRTVGLPAIGFELQSSLHFWDGESHFRNYYHPKYYWLKVAAVKEYSLSFPCGASPVTASRESGSSQVVRAMILVLEPRDFAVFTELSRFASRSQTARPQKTSQESL